MTERERVSATYGKIQKKYPNLENPAQKTQAAIQMEQRRSLWVSIALLLGSMLCTAIWCLLSDAEEHGTLRAACVFSYITCTFEYFRTVFNASKIKVHYGSWKKSSCQGVLTQADIRKEILKAGRSQDQSFQIVRAKLHDKDDRDDSAFSFIFHKYCLFFRTDDDNSAASFRVKRKTYLAAPLDAPYILALSPSGTVFAAYRADAWEIGADLLEFCKFDVGLHNGSVSKNTTEDAAPAAKVGLVLWSVLLLASYVLAFFVPALIVLLYLPVAVSFATRTAIKNKNVLTIFCTVIGYFLLNYLILWLFLA